MAGKIFINYRRDDSIGMAGRLHDRLAHTFGRAKLFMDVDHIPVGTDFVAHLNSQVAECDVILVIIGPNWLGVKDESGGRRLDDPDDFVAIEIAAALARDIRVIPVLVDGARMPKASELPDSLKPLARRHAVDVRHAHFGHDAEALVARMREVLGDHAAGPRRWRVRAAIGAAAVAVLLLVGWGGFAFFRHTVEREMHQAELKWEEERNAATAEAKRKAEEAEQQRLVATVKAEQAKAASEADAKRNAEEAERQRLADVKAEQERQAREAAAAEAKRKAEEAERQRLADVGAEQKRAVAEAIARGKVLEAEQQRAATAKAEQERQAREAAAAEAKRKAEEAERQRLADVGAEQKRAVAEAIARGKVLEAEQQRAATAKAEQERQAREAAELEATRKNAANTQKKYDPGATDTEIKIGNIMPYSGPASAYATIGKTEAAYFKKLNAEGGINGRKVNFISYDDGYSPPKTVEQTRKLVESDEVLLIFNPLGTPGNTAIQKYMNAKKVPQIFVASGATKWNDPKNFPWTMGWQPNYETEARIYAAYILKNYPGKTIGVLYQNDDFGKDYIIGLREGLGDQASKLIVIESSYEAASPTVDSQVVQIRGANPDIFINIATPKFAAQAIKKVAELNWHPIHFLTNVSVSGSVMKPAGYENDQGILSTQYLKDPKDPEWKNDPGMNEWRAFMTKWYPEGNQDDALNVFAYGVAKGIEQVLRQCKDDLTRENVMKQAANLNFEIGIYLPGTRIKTGPTDFAPLEQLQMMRFKGETWERFGPVMSGEKNS